MKKWLLLNDGEWQFVVPDSDIKPHTTTIIVFPDGYKEGELAGHDCPCKPSIDFASKMIIHNAFDGREKPMLQDILKDFSEKFVYDYFDNTGLEILGVRADNRPASYDDIQDFITHTYNTARKELVEEILREMPKEMKYDNKIGGSGSIGYNLYRHAVIDLLNKKI